MGTALKELGKYDEAIDAYKKALSINPNYAEAYYNTGIHYTFSEYNEAINAYKKIS